LAGQSQGYYYELEPQKLLQIAPDKIEGMVPNKQSFTRLYVPDWVEWRKAGPGAFVYSRSRKSGAGIDGLWFKDWWGGYLVDGHGNVVTQDPEYANRHILPFIKTDDGPQWTWDGNFERPTLTPSIRIMDRYYADPLAREVWHGWLRAGVFVSC
jgi:hypothetical protein